MGKHTDDLIEQLVFNTEGRLIASISTAMTGVGVGISEFSPLNSSSTLAKTIHSDSNAPMALFGNKRENGIDGRTSLVRSGNRRK